MSFATLARGCGGGIRRFSAVATRNNNNNITQLRTTTPRRFMGGGGQPISQSMEAELWQGHPKEPQGWETTVYLTYAATAVILGLGLGFAPDTSIKTWAQSEARARLTLQADGKLDQPVFGVHYDTIENKYDFESNNPDNPFNEDDDDDDDDDDDEEEEEEDDE